MRARTSLVARSLALGGARPGAREGAGTHGRRGAQVRFVVMNNLFPTSLPVQRQYDLKGSTLGRTAAGRGPVLKDLDLDVSIRLEDGWHDKRAPPLAARAAVVAGRIWRRAGGGASLCQDRVPGTERLAAPRGLSIGRPAAQLEAARRARRPRAEAPGGRAG